MVHEYSQAVFWSGLVQWTRWKVKISGLLDKHHAAETTREDISQGLNLSVGCIFTVVMIFCPFLGMKTTDDMGRFPKYIRKQRPKSNHTYLVLERMFSLATTLSILFFQEIKQDTREWINWHASAKSGKLRQAGYDPFSTFQTNQGA